MFGAAVLAAVSGATAMAAEDDPNLWLEEVQGTKALTQVKSWNAATAKILEAAPGFAKYRERGLAVLNDKRQLAYPDAIQRSNVTNFWQDATSVRGLWRVSTLQAYVAGTPDWRTLLDLDALSKAEGKNWVWKGATCLKPDYQRCLIGLSDGGKDALELREFDMETGKFLAGGFATPAAKTSAAWLDRDRLLIQSDFGPGTLTDSGYGRQVKLWKRGTPLAEATLVAEGTQADVGLTPAVYVDSGRAWGVVHRAISFWETELSHLTPAGAPIRSPLPVTAELQDVLGGRAIALLHGDWTYLGKRWLAGSVIAYPIDAVLRGEPAKVEAVYVPSSTEAVEEIKASANVLWVKVLDNVAGKLVSIRRGPYGWVSRNVPLAQNSVVHLIEVGGTPDMAFVGVEGLTQPETLFAVQPEGRRTEIASLPAYFDASKMEVSQRFAKSKDGTEIPYFVVRPAGTTGPVPTLMHAYGGFRAATNPTYLSKNPSRLGPMAQFWVEEGGAFVLANIRGGGEFGPAWHESVLKANRQKVFDDFHAVSEDLKKTGVASKLGVSGRSNGGLLVGVAYTQRPELYDAVLMGVPLSDMKRYNKLLAGASWMGEYGDPDKPEEWAYISKYSPYQNLVAGAAYPKVMIYTSTKDDRVHPGHARKMAARMEQQGHGFYYFENIEGGHAGTANKTEDSYRSALMMVYLNRELKGVGK
jgi:prolyl oligopeptidase